MTRVFPQSIAVAAIDVLGKLLGLATIVIASRSLGLPGLGAYLALLSVAALLSTVIEAGTNLRLIAVGALQQQVLFRELFSIRAYGALACGILGTLLATATRGGPSLIVGLALLAASAMALAPVTGLLAARKLRAAAVCVLVPPVATFLLFLFTAPRTLASAIIVFVTGYAVAGATAALMTPMARPSRIGVRRGLRMVQESLYVTLFNAATTGYGRGDTAVIGLMLGGAIAGEYGAYYRVLLAAVGVTSWISASVSRRLVSSESTDAWHGLQVLVPRFAACGLALAILVFVTRAPLQHVLYKHLLPETVSAVLCLVVVPTTASGPVINFIAIRGAYRALAYGTMVLCVIALAAYTLAAATIGPVGVAATAVCIEFVAFAYFWRLARRLSRRSISSGRL